MIANRTNNYQCPFFAYDINYSFYWTKTNAILPFIPTTNLSINFDSISPYYYLLCYYTLANLNTLHFILNIKNKILEDIKMCNGIKQVKKEEHIESADNCLCGCMNLKESENKMETTHDEKCCE